MADLQSKQSLASTLPDSLSLDFLKQITNYFSADQEICRSVFGIVYKGILSDGSIIAVKRFAENSPVSAGQMFHTEVGNLMSLRHKNIVQLVSYCYEVEMKLVQQDGRYVFAQVVESCVCFNYPPRGSLDKHLYADIRSSMDWDTRFKIIKGVCEGLHFLRKELDRPLIHMNLVPSSIWLDDDWVPNIADFGLSRFCDQDHTKFNTSDVAGYNGYMAPEYICKGEISTMSDIYSLGMLILEIVTGEKNSPNAEEGSATRFVDNVQKHWKTDEKIKYSYPLLDASELQQVKACIVIGLKCVEADKKNRPSIVDIINALNGKRVPIFDQLKSYIEQTFSISLRRHAA